MVAVVHPFIITGLTFPNCYVFYVRSVCSSTSKSNWVPIPSSDCTPAVIKYVSTLADKKFSMNENNTFTIFPNPSSGFFNIDLKNNNEQYTNIEVLDLLGKTIIKANLKSQTINEIDISNLNSGYYFAKIYNTNLQATIKLIKE